ncbi:MULTISPECIES: oxidoreductase [unclassified Streptomyces]|uniref:WD40/YVTN/BNR-like repeat-containing protein n=1 Tax=unclassified Streptomyces TaxID=2593676 RepID=UPI002DD990A4|nr:oxidoreductase [Streptomyces sp. NBC_01775]WSB81405.1 oxidoreductase [Streptomyces sp. NBC_01775]WSS45087.1 oxidoreductase [Streptomyces sp. NBC_01187]
MSATASTAATAEPPKRTAVRTPEGAAARAGQLARSPGWSLKDSGSRSRFRGLSAVSRSAAWVAGSGGTVLRTADGGRTWSDVSPSGAAGLELRDIETFGTRGAVVLAIGEGDASRVFRTEDGGVHWRETFRNDDPAAFYNCVTFFDHRNGLVVGDPVDGKFRILATRDGGRSWHLVPSDGMPAARKGETNFAASGQCLTSSGGRNAWFATGGGDTSRVFRTTDRGRHWSVSTTPLPAAEPARGVFALAFRDARHGLAVGGDYEPGEPSPNASATSGDGGRAWKPSAHPVPEYRSGVGWLPHTRHSALAVGPTGSDLTLDGGRSWSTFDQGSYDTVDCASDLGCWAAGEQGRIARLEALRP